MAKLTFQSHNKMEISLIAAIGKNNELGKDNDLIWHIPADLYFFKKVTTGHTIIMGRKTFESLPKMLPNRKHIVLSHSDNFPSQVEVYKNIKKLLDSYKNINEELFVIGGSQVYSEFIDSAKKIYLTEIEAEFPNADVYFPDFDKNEWIKQELGSGIFNDLNYKHVLYRRVK